MNKFLIYIRFQFSMKYGTKMESLVSYSIETKSTLVSLQYHIQLKLECHKEVESASLAKCYIVFPTAMLGFSFVSISLSMIFMANIIFADILFCISLFRGISGLPIVFLIVFLQIRCLRSSYGITLRRGYHFCSELYGLSIHLRLLCPVYE